MSPKKRIIQQAKKVDQSGFRHDSTNSLGTLSDRYLTNRTPLREYISMNLLTSEHEEVRR
jgi:hypothetical protein